ncbi:FG-GAP-like repeat-containing protein [Streptomyces sp. TBY4]|uniref:FG-GAP-like repeat-containing protein n=1 Tax=Streptomyces sp. TBY4 TaxID=2962030 RepID=UPI00265F8D1B|nr:FG-GAP-like repeat-containing protein [Streptomyces sp. TBY4]
MTARQLRPRSAAALTAAALALLTTATALTGAINAPTASAASVATWDKMADCEASGDWSYYREGHAYTGGLQFDDATWRAYGGAQYAPRAYQATKMQQILIAEKVLDGPQGEGAWPNCSKLYHPAADPADPYPDTPEAGPVSAVGDLTGDGRPDLLARAASGNGTLWIYPGAGAGRFGARVDNGGWSAMAQVTGVGDVTGDGKADVAAVEGTTGKLWIYAGQSNGHLGARVDNGGGWGGIRIAGSRDLTGDGRGDLLAVEKSTGNLWVYPGQTNGHFGARIEAGTNWDAMSTVGGAGDLNGDGKGDVVAVEAGSGKLFTYPGLGNGRLGARIEAGSGWGVMSSVSGAGDYTGDGKADIVAREKDGHLWVYPGLGNGQFGARVDNGGGWNFTP